MVVLEANYSKKVGLPGYSAHQYAITLRTEISDLSQVEIQSAVRESAGQKWFAVSTIAEFQFCRIGLQITTQEPSQQAATGDKAISVLVKTESPRAFQLH